MKIMKRMFSCLLLIVLLTLAAVPAFADDSVFLAEPVFCNIFEFDQNTWYSKDTYRALLAACMMLDSYDCGAAAYAENTMQAVAYGDVYIACYSTSLTGFFFTSGGITMVSYYPATGTMTVGYVPGDKGSAITVMNHMLRETAMISYEYVSNQSIISMYDAVFAGE